MTAETIRAEFERFMSDDGKWPQAIERDGAGNYILSQSASGWRVWRSAYHQCLQSPEVQALRKDAVSVRRDTLLSVLGKLNSNPYNLTKSECIDVVREMFEEADAAMEQQKLINSPNL